MSDLALLQRQFMDYLLDRPNTLLAHLVDAPGLDRAARAHIYFNAYRVRLVDALKDAYDKTWAWLGDQAFDEAAHAYIDAHPPSRFSLRDFGDRFGAWLSVRHSDDGEIAELAVLDWALRGAFDGADAPVLTTDDLAAVTPEQWNGLVLRPHPTLALLDMRYNTPELWHAMDRGDAPPDVMALPEGYAVRVWRQDMQPHFRSIDREEAALLAAMQRGVPFGTACGEVLAGDADEVQRRLARMFALWLEDGVLSALSPGGEN